MKVINVILQRGPGLELRDERRFLTWTKTIYKYNLEEKRIFGKVCQNMTSGSSRRSLIVCAKV